VLAFEIDADLSGFGVAHRVIQGFLGDAEEMQGGGIFIDPGFAARGEGAGEIEERLGAAGEIAQRIAQSFRPKFDGGKSLGEFAGLLEGAVDQVMNAAGAVGFRSL
jgi:hypothetical protein